MRTGDHRQQSQQSRLEFGAGSQRLIQTGERLISGMLSGPNEGRKICILKNIVFQSTF